MANKNELNRKIWPNLPFIGDLCDIGPDTDNDGVVDGADNCASISNSDQLDTDYDGNI